MIADIVLVVLAVALLPAGQGHVQKGPAVTIRVHVWTATPTTDPPSDEERGRLDSVRDLTEALRRESKLVLVDSPDEAQVSVEVVNREERDLGGGGFGGSELTPLRETIVRLQVRAGAQMGEMKGSGRGSWSAAAKDVAKRLVAWIENHGVAREAPRLLDED